MKSKLYLLTAVLGTFLISCSSDDSNNGDNGDNTPTPDNSFTIPLTTEKYWTYNVISQAGDSRDSLYISGDSIIGSNTYKRFEVKNNIATGFYSSSLRNNGVREFENKLLLSGDLSLSSGQQLPVGLDISLNDFIIFKKNATLNEILSTKTGVINQTVNGYPLKINYSLKSKGGESIPSFTSSNGDVYTNVRTSKIVLNVSITTNIAGFQIPVLNPQDVLTSVQYIANGIGVVYTNTVTNYSIDPDIASQFNLPASETQTQEEFLDTHN